MQKRAEQEQILRLAQSKTLDISEIKKSVGKLTKLEKSRIKAGDKTILYEKLGLVEEKDLHELQSKFSLKKEDLVDEDHLSEVI